ncbi:hypothetical protein [Nocardiopsis sp. CNR-923]|nr:hypothetical protein [Nocardiopsis sp. CNR-923]
MGEPPRTVDDNSDQPPRISGRTAVTTTVALLAGAAVPLRTPR